MSRIGSHPMYLLLRYSELIIENISSHLTIHNTESSSQVEYN
jgi:hypothetical protein